MPDAILATLILAPVVIAFFLKSNAALAYLALCVGFVLSTSVVGDLKHLLTQTNLSVPSETLALVLLGLPFLITLILSSKSHTSGLSFYIQLIVALLGGGLLALSAGPLINSVLNFNVLDSSFWTWLARYQSSIIGAGAVFSLLLIWLGRSHHHTKKH